MIIYDIEIEKAIPGGQQDNANVKYCKGWTDYAGMGIAVLACYDFSSDSSRVFMEDNLDEFAELIKHTDCLVGFNSHRFDNNILTANKIFVPGGRSYDILEEIYKSLGLGPKWDFKTHGGFSLDAMCEANFGRKKSGDGGLAPVNFQRGRIGSVVDYCLMDVTLTRKLLERIIKRGELINPKTGQLIKIRKPQ